LHEQRSVLRRAVRGVRHRGELGQDPTLLDSIAAMTAAPTHPLYQIALTAHVTTHEPTITSSDVPPNA
jgi:hypothetical protein